MLVDKGVESGMLGLRSSQKLVFSKIPEISLLLLWMEIILESPVLPCGTPPLSSAAKSQATRREVAIRNRAVSMVMSP